MTGDEYLRGIISKYAVNTTGAKAAGRSIYPILERWGSGYLVSADFSGSIAKGTGVSIGTDADIFLSLSSTAPGTLADMYNSLYNAVTAAGYAARKQDVSLGIQVNGFSVDLVPGRRQSSNGNDHSLYRRKANSWTQTNVATHTAFVSGSGRTEEIRVLKAWRLLNNLVFPSFFLELAVIDSLTYAHHGNLAANVLAALEYLGSNIQTARYIDPANTNNVVSEDCTPTEKASIANAARSARAKRTWEEIVS
ncbi:MAG: nucleotidyltransferase [Gammaproteobacteria bacterium]